MKKFGLICLCLILVLGLPFSVIAAEEQQEEREYGCYSLDAKTTRLGPAQITGNMEAAILYETKSDSLMYEYNADVPLNAAGFVKIMTGYLAAVKGNMEDKVTVTESGLNAVSEAARVLDLQVGEVLTLEDLMHCMLVRSSNEAATIIAEYISGSQHAFIEEMNRVAEEIGCTNTHFVNATGLHDDNQVTTARDIAKILEKALEYDGFRKAFCAADYTVPATNMSGERLLVTTNYLIYGNYDGVFYYVDKRVTGGRPGVTNTGKRMVAAVSEYESMEMISIVMGSDSEWSKDKSYISTFGSYLETSALLNAGYANLKVSEVLYENQALVQLPVENGECDVVIGPKESAYALINSSFNLSNLSFRYSHTGKQLEAPIEKGDYISTVEIWSDGFCVAMADLYAMNSVTKVDNGILDFQNVNMGSGKFGTILITALTVILIIACLLFAYRKLVIVIARKRRNRNRQNRRRS